MSPIRINTQIIRFGHATITLEPAIVESDTEKQTPNDKKLPYQEPKETASFSYEILYQPQGNINTAFPALFTLFSH